MGIRNKSDFNEGHIVEALDRCNTLLTLIDELLYMHPAIIKAGCNDRVESLAEELADIYTEIGNLK